MCRFDTSGCSNVNWLRIIVDYDHAYVLNTMVYPSWVRIGEGKGGRNL